MKKIKKNIELSLLILAVFLMPLSIDNSNIESSDIIHATSIKINNKDCSIQPPAVEWNKTFGGSKWDTLYCVQGTNDGGCIAVGVYTYIDDLNHAWILKLDAAGNEEWNTIETNELFGMNFLMTFVQQTRDGGYIVSGYIYKLVNFTGIEYDIGILWKVNSIGVTEWIKWYLQEEEPIITVPWVVYEVEDGYITAGYVTYINKTQDITLMKTNMAGEREWQKIYTYWNGKSVGRSLCLASNGGYLIGGTANNDFCMIKTNDTGYMQWYHTYGGSQMEYQFSRGCYQTSDGGYIINGMTNSYGAGNFDIWVMKTDYIGTMEWNKTYGEKEAEACYTLETTNDGGYIFAATKNYSGSSGTKDDFWVVRLDSNGYDHWNLTLGGSEEDRAYYISKTIDGGYIVSGRTKSYGAGDCDGWLIKIAPDPGVPDLQVDIKGGLGIKMVITNNGSLDAISVPWEIHVEGGVLGMINKTKNGTIDVIAGKSKIVSTGILLGFGSLTISTQVADIEKITKGTQFLIFSMLK